MAVDAPLVQVRSWTRTAVCVRACRTTIARSSRRIGSRDSCCPGRGEREGACSYSSSSQVHRKKQPPSFFSVPFWHYQLHLPPSLSFKFAVFASGMVASERALTRSPCLPRYQTGEPRGTAAQLHKAQLHCYKMVHKYSSSAMKWCTETDTLL